MGVIYQSARKVLIYLGQEDEHSKIPFEFLRRGYSELRDLGMDEKDTTSWMRTARYLVEHHSPLLRAFAEVLLRPWFSHIWVYQWYFLASSSPSFYCGGS